MRGRGDAGPGVTMMKLAQWPWVSREIILDSISKATFQYILALKKLAGSSHFMFPTSEGKNMEYKKLIFLKQKLLKR